MRDWGLPILLLVISNFFMTWAWYGHLKTHSHKALWYVILLSWGIAFFEYCFQVPANRLGHAVYTLPQLKVIQEVVTLSVFVLFSVFYMGEKVSWNYLWAAFCLLGSVYFIFREV